MNSLISLVDLIDVDGEARIRDLRLAEALGFARPRDIRKLIERYHGKLETFGICATVAQNHDGKRGRPTIEYALNAKQAAFIATRSELPMAIDFTFAMIDVFRAWVRDELPQLEQANPELANLKRGVGRPKGGRLFTEEQVKAIREERKAGAGIVALAEKHGVSQTTMHSLLTGITYKAKRKPKAANDPISRLTRRLERLEQRLAA